MARFREIEKTTSYVQNAKMILRTARFSFTLLLRIDAIRATDEIDDSEPAMIGTNMMEFC